MNVLNAVELYTQNGSNDKLYVKYILQQFKHFDVNPLVVMDCHSFLRQFKYCQ